MSTEGLSLISKGISKAHFHTVQSEIIFLKKNSFGGLNNSEQSSDHELSNPFKNNSRLDAIRFDSCCQSDDWASFYFFQSIEGN